MLEIVQNLIKEGLRQVNTDPTHSLPAFFRIELCEAFGPTFQPAEWKKRQQYIKAGRYLPTFADLVRSWLAIIDARKVIPFWREVLEKANILSQNLVVENIPLMEKPLEDDKRNLEFPIYLLNLAENVLKNKVDPHAAAGEAYVAELMVGDCMGFHQEEYPDKADYINTAAFHALVESYGHRTYSLDDIDNRPKYYDIFKAPPAGFAVLAYAGIYDGSDFTGRLDPQKSQEFWNWWLTEAVPQAWELAKNSLDS